LKILKSFILSVFSGLILGISWPTYGITALIFIGFVPLLYVLHLNKEKYSLKLFIYIYTTFLIWNFISTNWLFYATLEGMLFAIIVNSFLMTIVFSLYKIVSTRINEKLSFIFLISLWISFEKFHLIWDFSWPWLNLGNVFSEKTDWIQWYEFTGSFGGTLWVLIINILIFKILCKIIENKKIKKLSIVAFLILILPIALSKYIYNSINIKEEKINVFIVQPNIDPYSDKYSRSNTDNYFYLYNLLEKNKVNNSTIILPETFFSDGVQINSYKENELVNSLQLVREKFNSDILSGIELYEIFYDSTKVKDYSNKIDDNRWLDIFNSAVFVSEKNDYYNKSKLVVGVENIPYKKIIEPLLGNILLDFGGLSYSRGYDKKRKNFKTSNNFYISPIICYESVYGEYVTEYTRNGSNLLAIITNDGWWNTSEGHKQHLSYSKIRAIENRRNIVRSANTGISAIINYKGDVLKKINYGKEGFIKSTVGISDNLTFYVIYGDLIFRVSLFFLFIIFMHYFSVIIKSE